MIKSRTIRWQGHVAYMAARIYAYKRLVRKPEGLILAVDGKIRIITEEVLEKKQSPTFLDAVRTA
jgi:hypothetical protein